MFKVDSMKNDDTWDIIEVATGNVVGYIRYMQDARTHVKKLFVKEAFVDTVKSQKDACIKLRAFFDGVRTRIIANKIKIESLERDLKLVKTEHVYRLIQEDIRKVEKNIIELESLYLLSK